MNRIVTLTSRRIRHLLSSPCPSRDPVFERINTQFERAQHLVRFYYLFSIFDSYLLMVQMSSFADQSSAWNFLWPVSWLSMFPGRWAIDWLPVVLTLTSVLAFLFPSSQTLRAGFAILCLFVIATFNSKGGIDHGGHVWLWIGFCLVFLPKVRSTDVPTRTVKMTYLSVIVGAQALILSFYSLAGLWKVFEGIKPLLHGIEGNFAPRGLALQLADRMLATGTYPLLGDFVITNYWLIWPMFLAVMYVQFFAVFVTLRPRLHIVWGCVLILFHIGTWLLMQIPFADQMLCVSLLLVLSPFRPRKWNLREVLCDLPGFGLLVPLLWQTSKKADGRQIYANQQAG